MLNEVVKRLRPRSLLDVGTGCGHAVRGLLALCPRVVAIDPMPGLVHRWSRQPRLPGLAFLSMDGRALGFKDGSFDLVAETDSLHHMEDWRPAVREMLRVSAGPVYLEEPVNDSRSAEKRNTARARELFLALQRDVRYPHFPHLLPAELLRSIEGEAVILEQRIDRSDAPVSFAEYFESYEEFARRSLHPSAWLERKDRLQGELGEAALCEDDRFILLVAKRRLS